MKKQSALLIISVIILVLVVGLFTYYYRQSTPLNTTTNTVTYETVTDNELLILHLNNPTEAQKAQLTLTLTSHSKVEDIVNSSVAVQTIDGQQLGTAQFEQVGDTQTISQYKLRLVSATHSAVQILVLSPTASE